MALVAPRGWFVTPVGTLAAVLGVAACVVCAATPAMATVGTIWFAVAAVVLPAYRWWFERWLASGRSAGLVFALHIVLCFALVAMHPLFGAYAFTCYLDGPRALHGRAQWLGVLAAACVLSFSQTGGLVGQFGGIGVYLAFVLVNLAIATTMSLADKARERANQRRVEAVERLLVAERENAALQARLAEQAREAGMLEERTRLSREIHDTVAQGLVGIVRQLEAIGPGTPEPEWRPRVERAAGSARDALDEARRAVAALASPRLDADDLPTALDRLVSSWSATSEISGEFVLDGQPWTGPTDAVVLRLVQEALSNVARHSGATRVVVTLTYADALRLDIRDDGRGFDPRAGAGHGLAGMRGRVEEVGGRLDIESAPGDGCTISAEFPRRGRTPAERDRALAHTAAEVDAEEARA